MISLLRYWGIRSDGFITGGEMESVYLTFQFAINPQNIEWLCDIQALKREYKELLAQSLEWAGEGERTILTIFFDGCKRRWP
jgi:hypothetical protein